MERERDGQRERWSKEYKEVLMSKPVLDIALKASKNQVPIVRRLEVCSQLLVLSNLQSTKTNKHCPSSCFFHSPSSQLSFGCNSQMFQYFSRNGSSHLTAFLSGLLQSPLMAHLTLPLHVLYPSCVLPLDLTLVMSFTDFLTLAFHDAFLVLLSLLTLHL